MPSRGTARAWPLQDREPALLAASEALDSGLNAISSTWTAHLGSSGHSERQVTVNRTSVGPRLEVSGWLDVNYSELLILHTSEFIQLIMEDHIDPITQLG